MVRVHGSRLVTKRNRIHLRKILPLAPEQYVIPIDSREAATVPEHTKTEVTKRYVAVQPPKKIRETIPGDSPEDSSRPSWTRLCVTLEKERVGPDNLGRVG